MARRKRERLTIDFLEKHAVLFGSKALGVAGIKSDIDFAMLEEHFNKLDMDDAELNPLTTYFPYIPSDGTGSIIYKYRVEGGLMIDLLILSTQEHLDIISKAVTEVVDNVPRYMLVNKPIRVECYQRALEHFGFVANDRVRPMQSEEVWEPEMTQEFFDQGRRMAQEIPTPMRTERTPYDDLVRHNDIATDTQRAVHDEIRRTAPHMEEITLDSNTGIRDRLREVSPHVEPITWVNRLEMFLNREELRARSMVEERRRVRADGTPRARNGRPQHIPNHRADMQVAVERQQEAMRRMAGVRPSEEVDDSWL